MSNIDEARAKELKVIKCLCEDNLLFFTRYFFKKLTGNRFLVNKHHQDISTCLTNVYNGQLKNLLVNIPPRYGKTELGVVSFIAWSLAKNPKSKFIHLSYSGDLALDNSSRIKELVLSDEFQELWPMELKADSKSKKKWFTASGGGVYATAAGGAITGFGAGSTSSKEFSGAIIIDDPHKVDDAHRDIERNKVNMRLVTTIQSRRNSRKTPIIIIMQRLHEEDMSGFVLDKKMGEKFYHLKLPALDAKNNPLWEFKHTREELENLKLIAPYEFAGQYQQEPAPLEGEFFKRGWLNWYDDLPKHLEMYGASDYAVTSKGGDYTVHGVVGVDPNDDIYLVDWWRGQETTDVWIDIFLNMVKAWKPISWGEENGQILKSLDPFIKKRMREKNIYCHRKQFASASDKATRCQSIRGRAAMGKVYLPRSALWVQDFVHELLIFPNGKHDDQVDVFGMFGRMLDTLRKGVEPPQEQPESFEEKKITFDMALKQSIKANKQTASKRI